jgi:curved DNA-binding protein
MQMKDYYKELEISPDADEKTIKQAYRRLARQYHPDVNAGDDAAAERFKAINEAYQTLGDAEKRKAYDDMRQRGQYWRNFGTGGDADWSEWQAANGGRAYTNTVSPEDLRDIFGNSDIFNDIFGAAYGAGAPGGGQPQPRRGRDIDAVVELTLAEAFHGARRTVQVGDRRIEARIPPGVRTGSRVRLAGQGQPGIADGPAGDLYLAIDVLPDTRFERDGDNVRTTVPVDVYTAAIGGEVRVPTLDGSVRLKIPPQTQGGKTFRLRGKGMPRLEQPDEYGDLYARVDLRLPEPLSEVELEKLRELAQLRGEATAA